jgi:hypothetical protein
MDNLTSIPLPTSIPQTQDEYVKALKQTFVKLGVKLVLNKLIALSPIFVTGPLNTIAVWIATKILTVVVNDAETGIFFFYMDMRVHSQGKEFSKAAMANFEAQKNGTQEEKNETEKALIIAFNNLVKFTF